MGDHVKVLTEVKHWLKRLSILSSLTVDRTVFPQILLLELGTGRLEGRTYREMGAGGGGLGSSAFSVTIVTRLPVSLSDVCTFSLAVLWLLM